MVVNTSLKFIIPIVVYAHDYSLHNPTEKAILVQCVGEVSARLPAGMVYIICTFLKYKYLLTGACELEFFF